MLPANPTVYDSYAREIDVIAAILDFNTVGFTKAGVGITIGCIPAGAVLAQVKWQVITAFNAVTTNVITVGSNATVDNILSASDVTEGSIGAGLSSTGLPLFFANDTPINALYAFTGAAPTAGRFAVVIPYCKPERIF